MIPSYSPAPRFPAQRLELVGVIGGAEQGCRQAGRAGRSRQSAACAALLGPALLRGGRGISSCFRVLQIH